MSAILSRFRLRLNVFFDTEEEAVEFAKDKVKKSPLMSIHSSLLFERDVYSETSCFSAVLVTWRPCHN